MTSLMVDILRGKGEKETSYLLQLLTLMIYRDGSQQLTIPGSITGFAGG